MTTLFTLGFLRLFRSTCDLLLVLSIVLFAFLHPRPDETSERKQDNNTFNLL